MSTKEEIARAVQMAVAEEMKHFSYKVGNATLKALEVKEIAETTINTGAVMQSGYSVGDNLFQAAEDYSKGDKVCTGLCLAASVCEGIAMTTRVIKMPYGMQIYGGAKAISLGLMRFRNLCKNSKGDIFLC